MLLIGLVLRPVNELLKSQNQFGDH
jgi:hypothetical protein